MQPETESWTRDELIAGSFPINTESGTLASGNIVARGAVVGRITASGKFAVAKSASDDGSQTPVGIAIYAVDATGGDAPAPIYTAGTFRASALVLGEGMTSDAVTAAFDASAITLVFKDS